MPSGGNADISTRLIAESGHGSRDDVFAWGRCLLMTRAEPDDLLRQMLLTEYGESGPYEGYRLLRETAPVLVSASGVVVLSRYADCQAALRNRRLGKADESLGFRLTDVPEDLQRTTLHRFRRTMLFRNPPDHERLRRLVADAFTHRHVEQLRPRIAERIDHLLDAAAERERIDIISEIALPLPVAVIGDLLGVPESDRAAAAPLVRCLLAPLEPASDTAAIRRAADAETQLVEYFSTLLAEKRTDPQDDLLSRLAIARGADALDEDEMVGSAILLFAAGFETTTNLIGNGLAALLAHPDQLAALRDEPALASNAVEELLRYDAPVQTNGRTALADTAIGDVSVPDGTVVLMLLGSANRDPDRYDDPDILDLRRRNPAPLSFGSGIHFCLGAALARTEAMELFPRLLARFPGLAADGEPVWRPGLSFRGLASLPVSLT
ncbi:cytochrome P450 [Nocardia nova]|uniref:cytochrome P450 n=1 Tax=Nocardia TaxID=1817 RepID=UPI001E60AC8E|nr:MULTISPECIES: cytochrome P450 [Nocardia]